MADNVSWTAGSGTTVATDDVAGVHYQRVKLVDGTLDGTGAIGGDATNGLDVDVTRIIPGTGATNQGKAEDAVHTTGDTGTYILAVRSDTPAVSSGTDGDYSSINVDSVGGVHTAPVFKNVVNWIEVTIGGLTAAATSYTNGDVLGSEMTFANAARFSGAGGYIESFQMINNATQLGAVDAFIFDSASTPAADNAANSWSDANMQKCVAVLPLYPAATSALNQVLQWDGYKRFKCAATSLFVVLVTRADHTFFGASTDLLCKMSVFRD